MQSRSSGTARAGTSGSALDRTCEGFQLDWPEFFQRHNRPTKPEGFRCELVNPFAFPAEFAGTREDSAEEIVPVGRRISPLQSRPVDRPLLFQEGRCLRELLAREQEVGGDVEAPLQHPVRASKIRRAVVSREPRSQLANHRLDLLALLDRQMAFVGCDLISLNVLRCVDKVAARDLNAVTGTVHPHTGTGDLNLSRKERGEPFDEPM